MPMIEKADFARWLMAQARVLPPDQRRLFRKFIAEQAPKRPKKRRTHSWHKAKAARTKRQPRRQMDLGL